MTTTVPAPALPGTREWRLGLPAWIHDARGAELLLRFVTPADAGAIRGLHARCSEQALRWRYFGGGAQVEHLLTWIFDETRSEAVTAWSQGQLVAVGNLLLPDASGVGEVAFLVEDAWQGRGSDRRWSTSSPTGAGTTVQACCMPTCRSTTAGCGCCWPGAAGSARSLVATTAWTSCSPTDRRPGRPGWPSRGRSRECARSRP